MGGTQLYMPIVDYNAHLSVPIDQWVQKVHSDASKLSNRLKTNHSVKIENELQRQIKAKEQAARLERVLNNQNLKLKTNVEELKKKEAERKEKVDEALKQMRRKERLAQKAADAKREEDEKNMAARLAEVNKARLKSIEEVAKKKKANTKRV